LTQQLSIVITQVEGLDTFGETTIL
jgi:hypothetical protein